MALLIGARKPHLTGPKKKSKCVEEFIADGLINGVLAACNVVVVCNYESQRTGRVTYLQRCPLTEV